jgi:predicted amidohydrolase YtcJ
MSTPERGTDAIRFVNGSVFTGQRSRPWVDSVVMRGPSIDFVGGSDAARDYAPTATEVDLAGRTLLPGLIDAHNHFLATGEGLAYIGLQTVRPTSKAAFLACVAEAAATALPGEVLSFAGLDPAKLQDGLPTRWELDEVSPQNPVLAFHVSGHGVLVNSSVFTDHGIDDSILDPIGGSLARDANRRLTGLCFDSAMQLVVPTAVDIGAHGPNFHVRASGDQLVHAVHRAQEAFISVGLTAVCDAQVTAREMTAYRAVDAAGELSLRTVCMPLSHQLAEFGAVGIAGPFGGDRLRLGHMKFYADGSLIGHTALFDEPYGAAGDENGYLFRSEAELAADLATAYQLGWRVGVHTQGDYAIGKVLDAIAAADALHPSPDRRPRIEHAGLPTEQQIRRMSEMGVITINQPSYLYEMGDQFLADFKERGHYLQPLRSELAAGVRVVISSDSDVASYLPLNTIAAAMDRTTSAGHPIGTAQALTLDEALFAHTADAAFAIGWEDEIGSLEAGKAADITIVDGDLRGTDAKAIRDLGIWSTIIAGTVVHGPALD